ncbi:MAG TPA: hypothetical protein VIW24_17665 [Aldersonia sp.]
MDTPQAASSSTRPGPDVDATHGAAALVDVDRAADALRVAEMVTAHSRFAGGAGRLGAELGGGHDRDHG